MVLVFCRTVCHFWFVGLRRHRGWHDRAVPKSQCPGFRAWGGPRRNFSEAPARNNQRARQTPTRCVSRVYRLFLLLLTASTALPFNPHHLHHIAVRRQCLPNANGSPQEAASDTARCTANSGVQVPPGEIKAPRFVHFSSCDTLSLCPIFKLFTDIYIHFLASIPIYSASRSKSISVSASSPASSRRYPSSDSLRPQSPWLSARGWPEASPPNWLPTTPPYVVSRSFLGT